MATDATFATKSAWYSQWEEEYGVEGMEGRRYARPEEVADSTRDAGDGRSCNTTISQTLFYPFQ